MNLNSYISLMGHRWLQDQRRRPGPAESRTTGTGGDRTGSCDIPDSNYLLTLDADSLLLRDYCLRLVYFLESEETSASPSPRRRIRPSAAPRPASSAWPGPPPTSSTSCTRA